MELHQCLIDAGLDGGLLVALANQVGYTRALDEIFEPPHSVGVNSLAVTRASECHLAGLHASDEASQQVLISGVTQNTLVEVDYRDRSRSGGTPLVCNTVGSSGHTVATPTPVRESNQVVPGSLTR